MLNNDTRFEISKSACFVDKSACLYLIILYNGTTDSLTNRVPVWLFYLELVTIRAAFWCNLSKLSSHTDLCATQIICQYSMYR